MVKKAKAASQKVTFPSLARHRENQKVQKKRVRSAAAATKKKSITKKQENTLSKSRKPKKKKQPARGRVTKAKGEVAWEFGGRTCYGKLIPGMETPDRCHAETKNGRIKVLTKGLTSCPFTNWSNSTGTSVPTLDRKKYILGPLCSFIFSWTLIGVCQHASYHNSYVKADPKQAFPYACIVGFSYFFVLSLYTAIAYALDTLGVNIWFNGNLDLWGIGFSIIIGAVCGMSSQVYIYKYVKERALKKMKDVIVEEKKDITIEPSKGLNESCDRLSGTELLKEENAVIETREETKKEINGDLARIFRFSIVAIVICFVYPYFLIPLFNSNSVSDTFRVMVTTIFHSILAECWLTSTRLNILKRRGEANDYKTVIQNLAVPFCFELYLSMLRRLMIGSMQSELAMILTLAFCSIEEAVLRMTFIERERLWRKYFSMEKLTRVDRKIHHASRAVMIINAMICEVAGIILSKAVVIAARPHNKFRSGNLTEQLSFFDGTVQLPYFPQKYMLGTIKGTPAIEISPANATFNNMTFTSFRVNLPLLAADQDQSIFAGLKVDHPAMIALYIILSLVLVMNLVALIINKYDPKKKDDTLTTAESSLNILNGISKKLTEKVLLVKNQIVPAPESIDYSSEGSVTSFSARKRGHRNRLESYSDDESLPR
eukprot:g2200.t1